jgi:hypothetical protein
MYITSYRGRSCHASLHYVLSILCAAIFLTSCESETTIVGDQTSSDPHDEVPQFSRVFDGRDSVAWQGVDGPVATKDNMIIVDQFVATEEGKSFEESTPIYESREGNPVLAPDGHHVTWGEFSSAEGAIIAKCVPKGTHATVHLSGLIPSGLYSVWNFVFDSPGSQDNLENRDGFGALGPNDGSRNTFRASASGEGRISGITPPGDLTRAGEIGACALTDEFQWYVIGVYHIEGQTYGPDGTAVEQFGFVFGEESLPIDIR